MYCLFCVVPCIVCVYMCNVLLPPGGYPVAVKCIISYQLGIHNRSAFRQKKITANLIMPLWWCLFIQLHTAALRLIVRSWLDVPTFGTRRLHACHHARAPSGGRWNCGRETSGNFTEMTTLPPFRDLLHAVKLWHGTDGFASPPKEGVLRIFFALKIRRLRPGVNPRTWVPKASTLPVDHRSRFEGVTRTDCVRDSSLSQTFTL